MKVTATARARSGAPVPRARALLGQVSDMDLRLLQVFKAVVECGGLSAAELELNIGTSTVSRHLKDLETRLGLALCRRGRAGFALTTEGERVYDETLRLLAAVQGFRAGVDDIHQRMGGTLAVALFDKTASNPAAHIHAAIAAFAQQAPDVELHLHVGSIQTIERGVMDGSFAVGVIPARRASASLRYDRLFGETMYLYCGAAHPLFESPRLRIDWRALRARSDFAGLGYHSPNMALAHSRRLHRRATAFEQEAIATLILSGRFIGFLPDHYAQPFVQCGQMRAIAPQVLHYACDFVSVLRRSPQPARAALAFHQCLLAAHDSRPAVPGGA
jgi:DNA-binding transcriptional LysR family regulator